MTTEQIKLAEIEAVRLWAICHRRILPLEDASLYCYVSKNTLLKSCRKMEITYSNLGKFYYFRTIDIDDWMEGKSATLTRSTTLL
ncbi:hypothetical protein AGMMS49938_14450 [Fibrobacterales bacterium]|nr:hypothetical protein AGMMS49938_14450 [Fibrobacterales bacterium]